MHSELSALGCCSGSVGNDRLRVLYVSSTAMVMPQPVMPAVDPNQLAAQQQAFINQQAMLMVSRRDWLERSQNGERRMHGGMCCEEPTMLPFCLRPAL